MMARSSNAPSIGRIQKRKTNFSKSIIFGLQRAAGPYEGHEPTWLAVASGSVSRHRRQF